jgi:hypothetical protein
MVLFHEEAAFCGHIISPWYFNSEAQAAQHGSFFRRIMESRWKMYKSGRVSVSFESFFPLIFIE